MSFWVPGKAGKEPSRQYYDRRDSSALSVLGTWTVSSLGDVFAETPVTTTPSHCCLGHSAAGEATASPDVSLPAHDTEQRDCTHVATDAYTHGPYDKEMTWGDPHFLESKSCLNERKAHSVLW